MNRSPVNIFVLFFCLFTVELINLGNGSNKALAQVNNIKNRSNDNQNDRNINKTYTPPSNNTGGNNSYTPPSAPTPKRENPPPQNYNNRQNNRQNQQSNKFFNTSNDTTQVDLMGCNSCCLSVQGLFSSFLDHQRFLIQSKVVNPKIVSFEIFAIGALPFLYNTDSLGNRFFPNSVLSIPKVRFNWGLISSELRYTSLYQFGVGSYQTTDWQILMLNLFSRREFYLRVGTGFMYEQSSYLYFNEHTVSTDILLSRKLSGTFDFRFAHDTQTHIIPRVESGIRFNYTLTETKYADLNFTLGFLYQNYYQTDKLYLIQSGLGLVLH